MVPVLSKAVSAVERLSRFVPPVHPGVVGVGLLPVPIDDLDRPMGLHADRAGSVLGLTATESRAAVLRAEGRTVHEIVALFGRPSRSVHTHVKGIHRKPAVSRRADLVCRVLSVPERAAPGPGP